MAEFGKVMTRTAEAAADLSATQYHFLRHTAAKVTNIASNASPNTAAELIGVQQNKPTAAGQAVTVGFLGESKVVAGGSVTVNTWVTTNGSGRAADATSGDVVAGMALEAAASDGEVIRVLLFPPIRFGDVA